MHLSLPQGQVHTALSGPCMRSWYALCCSEDNLQMAIGQHSSVKDIRLVLDKFTGAPRGFAFVHFHTVADASRVLHALQVRNLCWFVGWLGSQLLVWLTNTLIG